MNVLLKRIEETRTEIQDLKKKQKLALDSWITMTKNEESQKKIENQASLTQTLTTMVNENQRLLERFETQASLSMENSGTAVSSSTTTATGKSSKKKKDGNQDEDTAASKAIQAFRKHLLHYCHGSHKTGTDPAVWKQKLPELVNRVKSYLHESKYKSFMKIVNDIDDDTNGAKTALILWYVDAFPDERKPLGYREAAGLPPPKSKSKKTTTSTSATSENGSDDSDSSDEEEEVKPKDKKTPVIPAHKEESSSSSSSSSEDSSSDSDSDSEPEQTKPVMKKAATIESKSPTSAKKVDSKSESKNKKAEEKKVSTPAVVKAKETAKTEESKKKSTPAVQETKESEKKKKKHSS